MNQSCCSLGFLSQKSLWKLSIFCGYKGIYSKVYEECKKSFFCKHRGFWRLTHDWDKSRNNWLTRLSFLSCNAPVVMTLQLLPCFTRVALWQVISRKSLTSSSSKNAFDCAHTWILHTLSHTTITWFSPKYRVSNCWFISKFSTE